MGILELEDVSLSLNGRQVLDCLTLDLWGGYIHALIGPNGAGKSTTANVIMGLQGYTDVQGALRWQGESLADCGIDERARRGITLAWQEPARFEGLPVKRFLGAAAADKADARLARALEQVGLAPADYLDRAVDRSLSGGERKRIELASILAMEPRLVLMDEPDSGIDVEALEYIFAALEDLKKAGATVLLITHSLTVLEHAEHAFLMCCGRILDKGSTEKIGQYFRNKCIPCTHVNRPALDGDPRGEA